MTGTSTMTRREVEETLKRYASALLELGRRVPRLQDNPLGSKLAEAIGAVDRLRSAWISSGKEAGERLHFLVTAVLPEHMETIQLALRRSAELCGRGASPSAELSLVCLDFLATNDFRFADEEQRLRFLAKFEQLTKYKFVIAAPEENGDFAVVYGIDTLARLARGPTAAVRRDNEQLGARPDAARRDGRREGRGRHLMSR